MRKLSTLTFALVFAAVAVQNISAVAQTDSDAAKKIADAVQPFVDQEIFAGAVMAVADKEKPLTYVTVGWADIEKRKPMKNDTLFWIASQSKPITATLLMMLVDEGKVSLDDPVEKYLPEFKGQMVVAEKDDEHILLRKPKHPITVRNVLSHTSGLPFRSAVEEPTRDLYPLSLRVRSYAMTPLEFEPDTQFLYSNAGINTAGRIVEVVGGMPFEKFLKERLTDPLGMTDTTFWPNEEQVARLAATYRPGPDKKGLVETPINQLHYPLTDRAVRTPMPGGGLFSTAHDMIRFYQMLLGDGVLDGRRYLSAESVKELTSRQTPTNLETSYGLGFSVDDKRFGHGGASGTNTFALRKEGLIFVWLVQSAGNHNEVNQAQKAFFKAACKANSN